jgi:hypothetical protein
MADRSGLPRSDSRSLAGATPRRARTGASAGSSSTSGAPLLRGLERNCHVARQRPGRVPARHAAARRSPPDEVLRPKPIARGRKTRIAGEAVLGLAGAGLRDGGRGVAGAREEAISAHHGYAHAGAAALEERRGPRLSFDARKAGALEEKPLHGLQEQLRLAHRQGGDQLGPRLRLEEGHGRGALRIESGGEETFAGQRIESELRRGGAPRFSELLAAWQRRGAVDQRGQVLGDGAERRSDHRAAGMRRQQLLRRLCRRRTATRAARRGEEEQRPTARSHPGFQGPRRERTMRWNLGFLLTDHK